MKGLKKIPSQKKLLVAYNALQFSTDSICVKDLVLWSQWSRLDPRLGELLVSHLSKFWPDINPVMLNLQLRQKSWPSAFGVLLEHIPFYYLQCVRNKTKSRSSRMKGEQTNKKIAFAERKIGTKTFHPEKYKKLFIYWSQCVMTNIAPAKNEQFFIGLYKAGGKRMKEECFYSIKPYRKWGYFARDLMLNKAQPTGETLIPAPQRKAIIDDFLKSHKKITVQDYLEKISFQIHRRQAQRDLQNHKQLLPRGNTKNKYYIFKD